MTSDIDRLHDVIQGRAHGRRCGKTYAMCHGLAGTIEVGKHDRIIVHIPTYHSFDHIFSVLLGVFDEHGLTIEKHYRQQREIICGGKSIRFLVYQADDQKLIGLSECDYCSIDD